MTRCIKRSDFSIIRLCACGGNIYAVFTSCCYHFKISSFFHFYFRVRLSVDLSIRILDFALSPVFLTNYRTAFVLIVCMFTCHKYKARKKRFQVLVLFSGNFRKLLLRLLSNFITACLE